MSCDDVGDPAGDYDEALDGIVLGVPREVRVGPQLLLDLLLARGFDIIEAADKEETIKLVSLRPCARAGAIEIRPV